MSKNGTDENKPSLGAFLFKPQFGRCLVSFNHVIPVFMRTLAIMFAQAGLIPRSHPALHYGYPGIPRSGFSHLMSEAWLTLRTKRTSPYQWLTYLSVVFMCIILIMGATRAIAMGAFGFGEVAHAQLYTLAGKDTSMTTLPSANSGPPAVGPSPLRPAGIPYPYSIDTGVDVMQAMPNPISTYPYDLSLPQPTHDHGDYGIMLLDKVLRQGTYHAGGYLQNGMQGMMAIYNTGVLVIAGIMLFWAILSVVIDTAKTGIVGGRRHNMVWAPIRIVFALGLLMPLSAAPCNAVGAVCGFSSGQVLVEKLAEWGSNLGTNAWNAYLINAANSALTAPLALDNATNLIQKYSMMWFCRVLYNGYQYTATSGDTGDASFPTGGTIRRIEIWDTTYRSPIRKYKFSNDTNANLCGTVTIPVPYGDTSARTASMSGPPNLSLSAAMQKFREIVYGAWFNPLGSGAWGPAPPAARVYETGWYELFSGSPDSDMVLDFYARAWACDMAMHFIVSPTPGPPGIVPTVDTNGDGTIDAADYVQSPLVTSSNCGVDIWEDAAGLTPVRGTPLGSCTENGLSAAASGPPPTPAGVNSPNGPFPWMRVGVGTRATPVDPGADPDFFGSPPPDPTSSPGPADPLTAPTNCIEEMTRYYAVIIGSSVSEAQQAFDADFASILLNAGRGWASMGEWYIQLTMINTLIEWARHPKIEITPGELVYTKMPREQEQMFEDTLSDIEREVMRATHTAIEWWKMQATAAEEFIPSIPINSCVAAAPVPVGQTLCPTNAESSYDDIVQQPGPHAISGDSGELSIQKNAIGMLGPGTDPWNIFGLLINYIFNHNPTWALDILQPGVTNLYPYTSLIKVGQRMMATGIYMVGAMAGVPLTLETLFGKGTGSAVALLTGLFAPFTSAFLLSGTLLAYWVPILPFIRVAFAVLTWIVSVFEVVVMVPLAALSHINTEGEGLTPPQGRVVWIMWLNLLLRPTLTVVGFVGSIMVFNGFIVYFNAAFRDTLASSFTRIGTVNDLILQTFVTVVYVGTMYIVANSSFKLVETIPNALMKYMGGAADVSFDDHSVAARLIGQAGESIGGFARGAQGLGQEGARGIRGWRDGFGGRSGGFTGRGGPAG